MNERTIEMWTKEKYQMLWRKLVQKKDENYIAFSKKIIQTKYPMLGIRIPMLRKTASFIAKEDILSYLEIARDDSYEEVMLQGILLGKLKSKDSLKTALFSFLPKIDNWALCDIVVSSLKIVSKEKMFFLPIIDQLLESSELYTRRVGVVLLLNYYVEEDFLQELFQRILKIKGTEYSLEMAQAWLLCECFITNQEMTYTFLNEGGLSFSLLSKTIQKICDSHRVNMYWKSTLKLLRQKQKELS